MGYSTYMEDHCCSRTRRFLSHALKSYEEIWPIAPPHWHKFLFLVSRVRGLELPEISGSKISGLSMSTTWSAPGYVHNEVVYIICDFELLELSICILSTRLMGPVLRVDILNLYCLSMVRSCNLLENAKSRKKRTLGRFPCHEKRIPDMSNLAVRNEMKSKGRLGVEL